MLETVFMFWNVLTALKITQATQTILDTDEPAHGPRKKKNTGLAVNKHIFNFHQMNHDLKTCLHMN